MVRFLAVPAAALLLLAGCESTAERQAIEGNTDALFLTEAAQGSQSEIRLGRLALEQSTNAEVKAFAQKMVDDHTSLFNQIRDTGRQMGLDVPSSVTDVHERRAAALENLRGAQFDKQYVEQMISDHRKDIATYEAESRSATDPRIRSLAEKALPDLRHHLKMAEELQKKLQGQDAGKTGSTSPSGTQSGSGSQSESGSGSQSQFSDSSNR